MITKMIFVLRCIELKRAAADSTPLLYGGSLRYDFNDTGGSNSAYYSPVHGGSPENRKFYADVFPDKQSCCSVLLQDKAAVVDDL